MGIVKKTLMELVCLDYIMLSKIQKGVSMESISSKGNIDVHKTMLKIFPLLAVLCIFGLFGIVTVSGMVIGTIFPKYGFLLYIIFLLLQSTCFLIYLKKNLVYQN